jgi:hypothetical protein
MENTYGVTAHFTDHAGFVGTVERSQRTDTTYFDCELVLADGRRLGAKWYELTEGEG